MGPRLSGHNCKFFMFLLSLNFQKKKTTPNIEVWPVSLGAMLEYWYIERGLLEREQKPTKQGVLGFRFRLNLREARIMNNNALLIIMLY